MNEEEKEAIEKIDYIQDFIIEHGQYDADINDMEYFSKILNLIKKQQKEIEHLNLCLDEENEKLRGELEKEKQLIFSIRNEVKDKLVVKDSDKEYRPCKNLTKQEVYKSFYTINLLLKGNYIFKSNETFIKELLEEK